MSELESEVFVHRAILMACLPCLVALVVAFALLLLVVKLSGARANWKRLRQVHACQEGGVQSLAFVVTLPLFMMILLFIVQVSQLSIGIMFVNYSAFAAARSATVWVPAEVNEINLAQNELPPSISAANPVVLATDSGDLENNLKYQKTFQAACNALSPVCPSRDVGYTLDRFSGVPADATIRLYNTMAPSTQANPRIPQRINNKFAYAYNNTAVRVGFLDKDSQRGPTYNPRELVELDDGSYGVIWNPHEVGWQDPVVVTVTHNFALLPGPGRFLAKFLVRADGEPDRISSRVNTNPLNRETIYTTPIWASATLTNEGFKSVVPYVYPNN